MGDFWQKVRAKAGELSTVFNGRPSFRPERGEAGQSPDKSPTPFVVRAAQAGHLPGQNISDHFRELESCTEWVYVATHTKAKQYAQASCSVKAKAQGGIGKAFQSAPDAPDEHRGSTPDHPFARLMRRPNPLTSKGIFLYQLGHQIELTGGAVIWERRNLLNQPKELWVLPRGWLYYQRPTAEYPFGYWRVTPAMSRWNSWYVGPQNLTQWNLDVRETVRVGWPSPLYPGEHMSPLAACSRLIDIATQTETAVSARMRNSIFPAVLLSIVSQAGQSGDPLIQEQIDQLKEQVKSMYAGADNAGTSIIANNVALQEFGATMEAMQGIESRKQSREFVENVFGVPPSATGAIEETSYAAFAAGMKAFISLSIDPVLAIIAEQLSHRYEGIWPGFEVTFDARSYDDPTLQLQRATEIKDGVKSGGGTWNEWRAAMGLPPRPDCDELVQQPDPNAMALGPDGQPVAGGAPGGDAGAEVGDDSDFADLDLAPTLGDDTTTGERSPFHQGGSGNRMPGFSRNGSSGGH